LSFAPQEKNAKNDNELGGSLSCSTIEAKQLKMTTSPHPSSSWSLTLEEKNHKMTMRLSTRRCFAFDEKNAENDNELEVHYCLL
jgi:hypothetical protein